MMYGYVSVSTRAYYCGEIDLQEALARCGMSRSTFYRRMAEMA